MGATQFNHGRQAEELVKAGLMRDLTELAAKEHWADVVRPKDLLDGCTIDGKVYCVPVNIHSWQWLWLSNKAFADAGVPVPKNWDEFVAAAPALEKAGKIPLAIGGQPWQNSGLFNVLMPGDRRQGHLPQGLPGQGRRGRGRARDGQGLQGGGRRPQDGGQTPTSRTGTRPPIW